MTDLLTASALERVTYLKLADTLAAALEERGFTLTTLERGEDLYVGASKPRDGFSVLLLCDAKCARIKVWSDAVPVHELTMRHGYGDDIAAHFARQVVGKVVEWVWRGGKRGATPTTAQGST